MYSVIVVYVVVYMQCSISLALCIVEVIVCDGAVFLELTFNKIIIGLKHGKIPEARKIVPTKYRTNCAPKRTCVSQLCESNRCTLFET